MNRRILIGGLFLLTGIPLLVWGNWRFSEKKVIEMTISSEEMALPDSADHQLTMPLEGRRLVLQGPAFLRLGDDALIRLILEPVPAEGKQTGTDVYDTHNLVVEARLELDGALYAPNTEIFSPMRPNRPVAFEWKIRPQSRKPLESVLWLHMEYLPHPDPYEQASSQRSLLVAPQFNLPTTAFFGLAGVPARVIGTVLFVVGLFVILEPILSDWIKKRIETKQDGN